MSIGIEINVEDVIARLDQLKDEQIPAFAQALLLQFALEAEAQMKKHMPFKTGQMRRSVDIREAPGGLSVGPHTNYSWFVATGTAPHMIFPRNKRALYWKGARHPVRSVSHPGTKAQPFHIWAAQGLKARAPEIINELIEKMLKAGGK